MANDYRDRDRGWRPDENRNRGMFGYEGEGFMRGGGGRGYEDYGRDEGKRSRHRGYDIGRPDDFATGFGDRGTMMNRERQSHRGRGPKNYQRSDDRIREDVCERLTMDDYVDASEIEVNVAGGTVTLTGSVHERHAKRRAEDIAESVHGVQDVQNQIRITRENETNP